MADQQELAKSGCFSRFLRLLLCAQSNNAPPIYPSDHFPKQPPSQTQPFHPNKPPLMPNPIPAPGVVARLMGLDSLPNTSRVSNRLAPNSVPRSKSVNFVDYLLQFDPTHHEGNHRRVRTSSSFREVPASSSSPSLSFLQQKNHEVVVLFWDDKTASKSRPSEVVRSSTRKSEVGFKESKKQRKEKEKEKNEGKKRKISKLKNEPRRVSVSTRTRNYGRRNVGSSSSSSRMVKEAFVEPKFRKRVTNKKSLKKMHNECCSENLSPVSVLDVDDDVDFTFQNETNFTDETNPMPSKSKRKSSAQRCLFKGVEDRGSNNNKGCAYPQVSFETEYCSELMAKLRNLTEKDVKRSDCGLKGMFWSESFEEMALLFEHKIFDLLLREVVDELVNFV